MAGVKGRRGGARPGAGRKPKAVECAAHHCCQSCAKRIAALHNKIIALERLLQTVLVLRARKPALPPREVAAVKLMREVAMLVPMQLPADIREEVAQAIVVDVLARKLARKRLDSQTVRRYINAAYGLRGLRFRSIDAPVGNSDGRTLGELLVA